MPKTKKIAPHPEGKEKALNPLNIQLDPRNPRLTKEEQESSLPDQLIEIMVERFKVEEVGESIVATGYIPFDPLIGWEHEGVTTILEGNRRIAAVKLLLDPTLAPQKFRKRWGELGAKLSVEEREKLKTLKVTVYSDRTAADIKSYMGFRHVTGPLPWPALEKASFIGQLVEQDGWTYQQIAERLGSYPKLVERHYVAYRIVCQAEEDGHPGAKEMRKLFGVLLRALQTKGVPDFLDVSYPSDPTKSRHPVPHKRLDDFEYFIKWTFGTETTAPVVTDSRQLTKWGRILQSTEAVRYLKAAPDPRFERAYFKSGGQVDSLQDALYAAADRLEEAVPIVSEHKTNRDVKTAVQKCTSFLIQILRHFPETKEKYRKALDV